MGKKVEFDEMLDVAYAEIYRIACEMEHSNKIDPQNNQMEEYCKDCKQIAADFVEWYEKEGDDFWGQLPDYAEKKLIETYPPTHPYDVTLCVTVERQYRIYATDRENAKRQAEETIADQVKQGVVLGGYVPRICEVKGESK